MRFCSNCGTQLSDQMMFCTACGAKVNAPPVAYQQPVQPPVVPTQSVPPVPSVQQSPPVVAPPVQPPPAQVPPPAVAPPLTNPFLQSGQQPQPQPTYQQPPVVPPPLAPPVYQAPQQPPLAPPVYQAPQQPPVAAPPVYQAPQQPPVAAPPVYQAPQQSPPAPPVYQAPQQPPVYQPQPVQQPMAPQIQQPMSIENVMQNAPYVLNNPNQPWYVTIEGNTIVARWNHMDARFFSPNEVTNETREYMFVVTLSKNNTWTEQDITGVKKSGINMSGGKIGFGSSSSSFKGKTNQKSFTMGVGQNNQTGEIGIVKFKFDTSAVKQPIRNYLTSCGWKQGR